MADAMRVEIMKPCVCEREKAIYYCKDQNCPNHTKQPFYCLFCFESNVHPNHMPVRIGKEVDEWEAKWKDLKEKIATLQSEATLVQQPFQCLIKMCERLMISAPSNQIIQFKSLTKDNESLTK